MSVERENEITRVRLAQSGNIEAFGTLVDLHEQQVYRLVRAMTANDQDAEQLLEATFLQAHEDLGRFSGRERFYTWLARIATRAAVTRLRQRHAFTWELIDRDIDGSHTISVSGVVQEWSLDPRCSYSRAELDAILARALDELEAPLRIIFALGDIGGFSLEEIADLLGLSVTVARNCRALARLKLRANLSMWFENLSVSASE